MSMENFIYYTPTEVIFGKETELQVGKLVKKWNGTNVLVHFGGNSAKKSGLLDAVIKSLTNEQIQYTLLGNVAPNPRLSLIRNGVEICKKNNIDFILAVGGGSVIDSAKGIAIGACHDFDVWECYLRKQKIQKALPIGALLTIAAAGSEMSDSSVVTNEEGQLKRSCASSHLRCKFAIMNPELTYTLPEFQTMCGIADVIMHTLERYFYPEKEIQSFLTDSLAEGLIKTAIQKALILLKNPKDYDARAEIMWASSLSHNGLMQCGNPSRGDWATHQLGHELSALFDFAHGATLTAVWGSWARNVVDCNPHRFAKLGDRVFNLGTYSPDMDNQKLLQLAHNAITKMEDFFASIKLPIRISDFGTKPTPEQIETLAFKCSYKKTRAIGSLKPLEYQDIYDIYVAAADY